MARRERMYRRLPGRRLGLFSKYTLWAGPDHLLSVQSMRLSERYHRFYYRDIQAIRIHVPPEPGLKLADRIAMTVLAMLTIGLLAAGSVGWPIFLVVTGGIYFALRALRRNCRVHVQTRAGVEELPALGRVRPARQALALIEAQVSEAQADFAAEVFVEPAPAALEAVVPEPAFVPPAAPAAPPLPRAFEPEPSYMVLAGLLVALMAGGVKILYAWYKPPVLEYGLPAAYTVAAVLLAVPLLRGHLKGLVGSRFAGYVIPLLLNGCAATWSVSWAFERSGRANEQAYRALNGNDTLHVIIGFALFAVAIFGLFLLRTWWFDTRDEQPSLFGAGTP